MKNLIITFLISSSIIGASGLQQAAYAFDESITFKCTMPSGYEDVLEYDSSNTDPAIDPYQYHYKIYHLTLLYTYQPRAMSLGAKGVLSAEIENLSAKNSNDHYRFKLLHTFNLNASKDDHGNYYFGNEVSERDPYGVKVPLLDDSQVARDITNHFNLYGTMLFYPSNLEGAARFILFKQDGATTVTRFFFPYTFNCQQQ